MSLPDMLPIYSLMFNRPSPKTVFYNKGTCHRSLWPTQKMPTVVELS